MAGEEDRLARGEPSPFRRRPSVSEPARGRGDVLRVLVDRPASEIPDREEPRVLGPAGCPGPDDAAARGPHRRSRELRTASPALTASAPRGTGRRSSESDGVRMALRRSSSSRTSVSSAPGTSSGSVERDASVADELRMAAAPAVYGRQPAGERLEQRVRRRVVQARGEVDVVAAQLVGEAVRRKRRNAADARRTSPGVCPANVSSYRSVVEVRVEPPEHVRALVRVVGPARGDDPDTAARERLARVRRVEDRRIDRVRDQRPAPRARSRAPDARRGCTGTGRRWRPRAPD